jgi:hypothetical protein
MTLMAAISESARNSITPRLLEHTDNNRPQNKSDVVIFGVPGRRQPAIQSRSAPALQRLRAGLVVKVRGAGTRSFP